MDDYPMSDEPSTSRINLPAIKEIEDPDMPEPRITTLNELAHAFAHERERRKERHNHILGKLEEINGRDAKQSTDLEKLLRLMVGEFGQPGLVERVADLEDGQKAIRVDIEQNKNALAVKVAWITGAGAVLVFLLNYPALSAFFHGATP